MGKAADGPCRVATSHASFCLLDEARSLLALQSPAALLTPPSLSLVTPAQPVTLLARETFALPTPVAPTCPASNGCDPTTPRRRKGCLQHLKAAWGIPISSTPIRAIKESSGQGETSKPPRLRSKVGLSNHLWARGAWGGASLFLSEEALTDATRK